MLPNQAKINLVIFTLAKHTKFYTLPSLTMTMPKPVYYNLARNPVFYNLHNQTKTRPKFSMNLTKPKPKVYPLPEAQDQGLPKHKVMPKHKIPALVPREEIP